MGEVLAKVLRVEPPSADDTTVALVASLPRGERADLLPLLNAMIEWRGRRQRRALCAPLQLIDVTIASRTARLGPVDY